MDRQVPELIAFPVECYCVLTCCQWPFVITANGLRKACGLEDVYRAPFLAPLFPCRGFWSASNSIQSINQSINQSIHTGQDAIAGCLYMSGRLARSPHMPLHVHVFISSLIWHGGSTLLNPSHYTTRPTHAARGLCEAMLLAVITCICCYTRYMHILPESDGGGGVGSPPTTLTSSQHRCRTQPNSLFTLCANHDGSLRGERGLVGIRRAKLPLVKLHKPSTCRVVAT